MHLWECVQLEGLRKNQVWLPLLKGKGNDVFEWALAPSNFPVDGEFERANDLSRAIFSPSLCRRGGKGVYPEGFTLKG